MPITADEFNLIIDGQRCVICYRLISGLARLDITPDLKKLPHADAWQVWGKRLQTPKAAECKRCPAYAAYRKWWRKIQEHERLNKTRA